MFDFLSDLFDQGGTPFNSPESGEHAVFDRLNGAVMFAGVQNCDGNLGVGRVSDGEGEKESQGEEGMHHERQVLFARTETLGISGHDGTCESPSCQGESVPSLTATAWRRTVPRPVSIHAPS